MLSDRGMSFGQSEFGAAFAPVPLTPSLRCAHRQRARRLLKLRHAPAALVQFAWRFRPLNDVRIAKADWIQE